jgi:DegV family protein with EDD domain
VSRAAVVTDSSAQIASATAAARGIEVVPVTIQLGKDVFDETELAPDAFYERLAAGERATTSQPSPGRLAEAYASAAERGAAHVVSVHLDARVSGTVEAALLAAREAPLPVSVVDTGVVSFGVGLCALAAADAVARGQRPRDVVELVGALAPEIRNAFVAGGADGGRVPRGDGLHLLEFADGCASPFGTSSNLASAATALAARVGGRGPYAVAVGHAHHVTADAADELAGLLEGRADVVEVVRYRVGPSVGAHTGPLSFGLFWWPSGETRRGDRQVR